MSLAPGRVSFRIATPDDYDLLAPLVEEMLRETAPPERAAKLSPRLADDLRQGLAAPEVCIFFAILGTEAMGYSRSNVRHTHPDIRFEDDPRSGYLDQLYVRPKFRRRALATQLVGLCEDWLRGLEVLVCFAHPRPKSTRFYARHGWKTNREMCKGLG